MSYQPVKVTAPGLETNLPANLDRGGPRLPIGQITVLSRQTVQIVFDVEETPLSPPTATATFPYVVATPAGERDRIVSIAEACGKYVDWYRSAER